MKKLILTLFVLAASNFQAMGTEIYQGHYDENTDEVVLTVGYGGGCGDHHFSLDVDRRCVKTYPAKQKATLVHQTNDRCEAFITQTIRLPLEGIDHVCRPSKLTINSNESSVQVYVTDKRVRMTGKLVQLMAIGGETTGLGVKVYETGKIVELLLKEEDREMAERNLNRPIEVAGRMVTVEGVEIPKRLVLKVFEFYVLE